MHLILVGNYGVGNLGDEALKDYFLERFPEITWTVVSARPEPGEVPRLPLGIRSLFQSWWRTLWAVYRSDGMVFGGGSLLTDVESPFACMLWGWHAAAARFFGKPVYLAFQGIGPFQTTIGRACAAWVLKRASFVSVRDAASVQRASEVSNRKVIQSFDPVLSLLEEKKLTNGTQKVLNIIPRKNSGALLRNRAMELYDKQWSSIRILSLEPDHEEEQTICQVLARQMHAPVIAVRSLEELYEEVSHADLVLTQRYHGALAAWAAGVPVEIVPQGTGDKLAEFKTSADPGVMRKLVMTGENALREALGIRG